MRNRELVAEAQAWFNAIALATVSGDISSEVAVELTRSSANMYKSYMRGERVYGKTLDEANGSTDNAFADFADILNAEQQGFPNA